MRERDSVIQRAREVVRIETEAVASLADRIGDSFVQAVEMILESRGRVVVTGVGKSGAIARKLAATLASTGTPALYLHAAEGVHGELGVLRAGDVVVAVSRSGESGEIVAILPILKRLGVSLVAITGRPDSTVGAQADVVLDASVAREACPLDLTPTASTAAALVMGDALALALMDHRRFTSEDIARLHPGGAIGRRLVLRVVDLMRTETMLAAVPVGVSVRDALFTITAARAGMVNVLDSEGRLLGILTDGDIRRLLLGDEEALTRRVETVLKAGPRTTRPERLVAEALAEMQRDPPISEMPVLDEARRVLGVLNLADIVRAGIL